MGPKLVSVIQNSGVSAVKGFLNVLMRELKSMEIHSEVSIILQVSAVEGYLLSGVPLYTLQLKAIVWALIL